MADWQVIQHFGDEAGPMPVLVIFDGNTSNEDIDALAHNFIISFNILHIFDDDIGDFYELSQAI